MFVILEVFFFCRHVLQVSAQNALSRRMTVGTDQVMVNRLHYDRYLYGGPRRSRSTASRSKSSVATAPPSSLSKKKQQQHAAAPNSSSSSSSSSSSAKVFAVLVENVATTVDMKRLREVFARNHVRYALARG